MTGQARRRRPRDDATTTALQGALAAENAAIFGYGVAGAYLAGGKRAAATAFWNDHREARDTLAALLRARGQQPAAADDAYKLPIAVHDAAGAVSLAIFLEDGVTAAYLGLVGTGGAGLRVFAARAMQDSAVRAGFWRGSSVPFPGITAAELNPRSRHAPR